MSDVHLGQIVQYVFGDANAYEVMRRRTTGPSIYDRMNADPPTWPVGAQAHIGNNVTMGTVCPAMVVRMFGDSIVNLKVMLDGSDTYWATSVAYDGAGLPGTWRPIP